MGNVASIGPFLVHIEISRNPHPIPNLEHGIGDK